MLSRALKLDLDCVMAAHKARCLSTPDLPRAIAGDRDLWMDLVEGDSSFWLSLPVGFADDVAFALAIGEAQRAGLLLAAPKISYRGNFIF